MKQSSIALSVILAGLAITAVSCDYDKPTSPAAKIGTAATVPMSDGALVSVVGSPGQADNDEGVSQYKQGHMDVAANLFQKALKSDPKSAEAQYNLGLSLDKMGKHDEATAAFKQAVALAPANPAIKDSPILKKHLGA
ncbi:MAG: tetratricopeptide repeat protein [Nitrospirota bacterium]|nr:tetratricopeptide repeat protein [Nitrospirota bacterium]MDP2383652.1 tetratricopeptide repeat protein [Nitrospirota bacterium]MDP3595846.1 tetratricopeptide repeat protein [Nitrospirota bacterium]